MTSTSQQAQTKDEAKDPPEKTPQPSLPQHSAVECYIYDTSSFQDRLVQLSLTAAPEPTPAPAEISRL